MDGANFALFKDRWIFNAFGAMRCFDAQLSKEESPFWRSKMSEVVANKLRRASRLERNELLEILRQSSMFCKLHVSSHFTSIHDSALPRYFVFSEHVSLMDNESSVREDYVIVCGKNKSFQLGVSHRMTCDEPVRLNITKCRKVCMGTDHTLFLKLNGELHGCGLVSALTHGSQNKFFADILCEYVPEPTMLSIPGNEEVLDIAASDSFSIILTKHYIYVIGDCTFCEKYITDDSWVCENSKRFKINDDILDNDVIDVFEPTRFECSDSRIPIPSQFMRNSKGELQLDNKSEVCLIHKEKIREQRDHTGTTTKSVIRTKKVELVQEGQKIKALRSDGVSLACHICLNGKFIENDEVEKFVVSPKGKIFVHFTYGFLAKGMVKLMKTRQFSTGPLADSHSHSFEFTAVIIVDEVPGSFRLSMFSASPDCESLIMMFCYGREYQIYGPFESPDQEIYQNRLFESVEEEAMREPRKVVPNEMMERLLEEVICCRNEWREKFPQTDFHCVFLEIRALFQDLLQCCELPLSNELQRDMCYLYWRRSECEFSDDGKVKLFTLEELAVKFRSLLHRRSYLDDEKTKEIWLYIFITLRMMKNSFVDDDGEFVKFKFFEGRETQDFYKYLKLDDIEGIKKRSYDDRFPLSENEVPLDLTVIFVKDNEFKTAIGYKNNEVIFRLMYPPLATKIDSGKIIVNKLEFGFIFNRPLFFKTDCEVESIDDMVQYSKIETHRTDVSNVFQRLTFENEITDLFPLGSDEADIWMLKTGDGKCVKVHKNLLLLHSQVVRSKMILEERQDANRLVTFDVDENETVVIAALRAILDPLMLFKKPISEVMEIFKFYNSMDMIDACNNAVEVVFQLAAPNNFSCLHEIYDILWTSVISKFDKYKNIFLPRCDQSLLPLSLMIELSDSAGRFGNTRNLLPQPSESQNEIDEEDLKKYFNSESKYLVVEVDNEESSEPSSKMAKTGSMNNTNFALFEDQWNSNALEAMEFFDEQLKEEKSPFWQIEMSKLVANKLRQASRFERYDLLEVLSESSLFCKCLVSSHFTSIHDLALPRYFVFNEELAWKDATLSIQEEYVVVCGKNASCQLGVPNGSACYEPVRLNITQCRKVCMGTDHTLFLKMTGEVYGCGLVSALTHGSQKKLFEDSSCRYITEPTMILIPDNEEVLDIFASDSYSILLTKHYVYVIGSCSFCEKYKCDVSWVSENSKRIITNNHARYEWYDARICFSQSSISIVFDFERCHSRDSKQSFNEDETSKYENCGGASSKKKESLTQFPRQPYEDLEPDNRSEVFLFYKDGVIRKVELVRESHRIKARRCDDVPFDCHICLNGKFIENYSIEKFVVSREGNIYVHFEHGFLAKGMVKLMKKEQFSNGPLPDSHSNLFEFAAVIILDEVPTSYGLTTFSASPDCENVAMLFGSGRGYRYQETLVSESTNHKIHWDFLLESIVEEATKEPNKVFSNELMEKNFGRSHSLSE